jgi:hypothetical protein
LHRARFTSVHDAQKAPSAEAGGIGCRAKKLTLTLASLASLVSLVSLAWIALTAALILLAALILPARLLFVGVHSAPSISSLP